jgi:hypothetical protein
MSQFIELDHVNYAFNGSIAVNVGDLVYMEGDDVRPASSMADQGTEQTNQRRFARFFAGVAQERRLAAQDNAGPLATLAVSPFYFGDIPCASSTFEVGDLLAAVEQGNGTQLENLKVKKTTDPDLAIGRVIRRAGTAVTSVRAMLVSRLSNFGLPGNLPLARCVSQNLAVAGFTDNGNTTGYIDFTGDILPAGALVLGWLADVTGAFAGDTSAAISVGKSGAVGCFSADTTQSAFTTGRRGSASVVATSFCATATTPRVTVTGNADFTSIVNNAGGAMQVTIFYIPMLPIN